MGRTNLLLLMGSSALILFLPKVPLAQQYPPGSGPTMWQQIDRQNLIARDRAGMIGEARQRQAADMWELTHRVGEAWRQVGLGVSECMLRKGVSASSLFDRHIFPNDPRIIDLVQRCQTEIRDATRKEQERATKEAEEDRVRYQRNLENANNRERACLERNGPQAHCGFYDGVGFGR